MGQVDIRHLLAKVGMEKGMKEGQDLAMSVADGQNALCKVCIYTVTQRFLSLLRA